MVVSPILRGLFGLQADAEKHQVTLAPHVPADWTAYAIHGVHVGAVAVDFQYRKAPDSIVLEASRTGRGDCWVEFSPALSLRAEVISVKMNGRPLSFKMEPNHNDQHLHLRFPIHGGPNNVVVRLKKDFGLSFSNELPPLGSSSQELRVISESWNAPRSLLTLDVSGLAGRHYELGVCNPAQVSSVDGAVLTKNGKLEIQMPQTPADSYVPQKVTIHFGR